MPAIVALRNGTEDSPVRALLESPDDERSLRLAVEYIVGSDAIEESYAVASGYCQAARRQLDALPDTPARASLAELIDYVKAMRP